MSESLMQVQDLCKYFSLSRRQILKAVDHVSFELFRHETLGIVGESGCGKTTLGRTLLGLYKKSSGHVVYDGLDIHECSRRELLAFKRRAQIILQDPYSSLNPRMTVGEIIREGIEAGGKYSRSESKKRIDELLEIVGLTREQVSRFPHEFSGGQRQRIGIARTLAVEPEFIVCDEPISALDVSIQAQIVNLLLQLQKELGLTYIFIAHDMAMVRHISTRVAVMYLGSIAEIADSRQLYQKPFHPYTKALLSAIPSTDLNNPVRLRRIRMQGELQSPINLPCKCKFSSRCPYKLEQCEREIPVLQEVEPGHQVACFLYKNDNA